MVKHGYKALNRQGYEVSKVEGSISLNEVKHATNNDRQDFLSFNLYVDECGLARDDDERYPRVVKTNSAEICFNKLAPSVGYVIQSTKASNNGSHFQFTLSTHFVTQYEILTNGSSPSVEGEHELGGSLPSVVGGSIYVRLSPSATRGYVSLGGSSSPPVEGQYVSFGSPPLVEGRYMLSGSSRLVKGQ
ncbi:hypothetical protein Tco_0746215 [Tanacetum coccineum]